MQGCPALRNADGTVDDPGKTRQSCTMIKMFQTVLASLATSFLSFASSANATDPSLSETLAWMDSTYNPHLNEGGGFGHGVEEIYLNGELRKRRIATFTYDSCQLTIQQKEDPTSPLYSKVFGSYVDTFNLRDIDPLSIKVLLLDAHSGGLSCNSNPALHLTCDLAEMEFQTRSQAPLIDADTHITFAELKGSDHEAKRKSKTFVSVFYFDDVQYATRFAKAFRHATELCGGKPSPF